MPIDSFPVGINDKEEEELGFKPIPKESEIEVIDKEPVVVEKPPIVEPPVPVEEP